MAKIFISFRNGDEPFAAALVARALGRRFGPDAVFRSSESIGAGERWEQAIWAALRASAAIVVVIGPRWLTIAGPNGRRLDDPYDWVRREVATALAAKKLVIPVMIEGTARFTRTDLPGEIGGLAELQSVWLSHRSIDPVIDVIADRIRSAMPSRAGAVPENVFAPAISMANRWPIPGKLANCRKKANAWPPEATDPARAPSG